METTEKKLKTLKKWLNERREKTVDDASRYRKMGLYKAAAAADGRYFFIGSIEEKIKELWR